MDRWPPYLADPRPPPTGVLGLFGGPTSPTAARVGRIDVMTDAEVTVAPAWKPLALLFALSGTMHFVTPGPFEAIVPRWLPARVGTAKTLVRVSGAAELVCAAGLARAGTRRPAGLASAVLLAAVYPANVDMA